MNSGRNTTIKDDLELGTEGEISILPKLHKYFMDNTIQKTVDKYCVYDYEAENGTCYEVKTRRNTKGQYPTTLLPAHKILHSKTIQYFIFSYLDKDCYIKYDKESFAKYETIMMTDCRVGMGYKKIKHYLIPVSDLIDF
jgi:hypothetical protein